MDRAARLLREVVDASVPVSFSVLAAATDLPRSTTSRLLVALERHGLVRRDPAGAYEPGEVFVAFAWRRNSETDLVSVAKDYLDRLAEATGETVNLGVVHGTQVRQIAQVDSRFMIGGTNWLGRSVPLHCSALGKVLLASGAAELPAGRLERRTPQTITSRAELARCLEEAARRGYALTEEELEPGLVAVAAPVLRDGGLTVAALSVTAPASRLPSARLGLVTEHTVAEAAALSAALGYKNTKEGAA